MIPNLNLIFHNTSLVDFGDSHEGLVGFFGFRINPKNPCGAWTLTTVVGCPRKEDAAIVGMDTFCFLVRWTEEAACRLLATKSYAARFRAATSVAGDVAASQAMAADSLFTRQGIKERDDKE